MAENLKITPGPWNICWGTYDGQRVNFHITASPYGSVYPICETRWRHDWSEAEREQIEANANAIASIPMFIEATEKTIADIRLFAKCFDDGSASKDFCIGIENRLREALSSMKGGK